MFLAVNVPNLLSIDYRYLISESIRQLVQHSRAYNQSKRRTHLKKKLILTLKLFNFFFSWAITVDVLKGLKRVKSDVYICIIMSVWQKGYVVDLQRITTYTIPKKGNDFAKSY